MGEIAGEGGFAPPSEPTPPGYRSDTGDFIPYRGPGNYTDIGGFTPRQVGYRTEHGDFEPYEATYRDEQGGVHPISPGPYNSPIYGEGYIDSDHIFHPKFNAGEGPAPSPYGPAPDYHLVSHIENAPAGNSGILSILRGPSNGHYIPSIPGQSEESMWLEYTILNGIAGKLNDVELTLLDRFNSEIYPNDLPKFVHIMKDIMKDGHLHNEYLERQVEYLRNSRVEEIVDDYACGLYCVDKSEVFLIAEEAVKKKIPIPNLYSYLVPRIERILQKTNGYAGYRFDDEFQHRNEQIRELHKQYGQWVYHNFESDFHDAIIDGIASGLKGNELIRYVQSKASEFEGWTDNDLYEALNY